MLNILYLAVGHYLKKDIAIKVLTNDQLIAAVSNDHIESVYYHADTKELGGIIKKEFRPQYEGNKRFTFTGDLGVGVFEQIMSKNLGGGTDIGRGAGLDKNVEFDALAQIRPRTESQKVFVKDSFFRVGEKAVLQLKFMGLPAGHLIFETLGTVDFQNRLAYELRISIKSAEGFKFYRINDTITTYIDVETLELRGMAIVYDESSRYGSLFMLVNGDQARYWENAVEKNGKRRKADYQQSINRGAQMPIMALSKIRQIAKGSSSNSTFTVTDRDNIVDIALKGIRDEVIDLSIGKKTATLYELTATKRDSQTEPMKVQMWLLPEHRNQIGKVEATLKLGKVAAELKELN